MEEETLCETVPAPPPADPYDAIAVLRPLVTDLPYAYLSTLPVHMVARVMEVLPLRELMERRHVFGKLYRKHWSTERRVQHPAPAAAKNFDHYCHLRFLDAILSLDLPFVMEEIGDLVLYSDRTRMFRNVRDHAQYLEDGVIPYAFCRLSGQSRTLTPKIPKDREGDTMFTVASLQWNIDSVFRPHFDEKVAKLLSEKSFTKARHRVINDSVWRYLNGYIHRISDVPFKPWEYRGGKWNSHDPYAINSSHGSSAGAIFA